MGTSEDNMKNLALLAVIDKILSIVVEAKLIAIDNEEYVTAGHLREVELAYLEEKEKLI
jgi:hypothetical protein